MSRSRRLGRGRPPPIAESAVSFHFISVATAAFFVVCLILAGLSSTTGPDNFRSSTSTTSSAGSVFRDPKEVPSDLVEELDLILVLGGGVPSSLESPPSYVQRRCDDAAHVVKQRQELAAQQRQKESNSNERGLARKDEKSSNERRRANSSIGGADRSRLPILCLSAGTAHMPQLLASDGLPIWESTASAAYLLKQHGNINPRDVYVETTSYDTIGNAYFTRTSHTDVAGWRKLLVITNEFHMSRTKAIFDWIFGVDRQGYQLYYLSSRDVGLPEEAIKARLEKESESLKRIQQYAETYRSLKDVWQFLNSKHDLYTASKLVERGRTRETGMADLVKESYGGSP